MLSDLSCHRCARLRRGRSIQAMGSEPLEVKSLVSGATVPVSRRAEYAGRSSSAPSLRARPPRMAPCTEQRPARSRQTAPAESRPVSATPRSGRGSRARAVILLDEADVPHRRPGRPEINNRFGAVREQHARDMPAPSLVLIPTPAFTDNLVYARAHQCCSKWPQQHAGTSVYYGFLSPVDHRTRARCRQDLTHMPCLRLNSLPGASATRVVPKQRIRGPGQIDQAEIAGKRPAQRVLRPAQ